MIYEHLEIRNINNSEEMSGYLLFNNEHPMENEIYSIKYLENSRMILDIK